MVERCENGSVLPAAVREGLDGFQARLRESLGDSLLAVVLYGGLAKGHYFDSN